jgi:hypothetical protein
MVRGGRLADSRLPIASLLVASVCAGCGPSDEASLTSVGATNPAAAMSPVLSTPPRTMAPDPGPGGMAVSPTTVVVGAQANVTFSGSLSVRHGGYFHLVDAVGEIVAGLRSNGRGDEPAATLDVANFEILDYAVTGPGPDVVVIPAELQPGRYDLCTANSTPETCVTLNVTAEP